jgi:hypothetical protein
MNLNEVLTDFAIPGLKIKPANLASIALCLLDKLYGSLVPIDPAVPPESCEIPRLPLRKTFRRAQSMRHLYRPGLGRDPSTSADPE